MIHIPTRNFFVCCYPRTGSNLLCETLAKRGDLEYFGEYYPVKELCKGNYIEPMMDGPPGRFFKLFYWYMVYQCQAEPGYQARWDILEYLRKDRVDIIHLRRRNLLDIAISQSLAKRNQSWASKHYKEPIEITPQDAEHYMWSALWMGDALDKGLTWTNTRHLNVWYEDLAADIQEQSDMISHFLQMPKKKAVVPRYMIRQRQGGQSKNVTNYDALKEHFKDTFYAQFFED